MTDEPAELPMRISMFADLLSSHPLPGDDGDIAYELLIEAAARIGSDRLVINRMAAERVAKDAQIAALTEERDRLRELTAPNCWWDPDDPEKQMSSPTEHIIDYGDYNIVREVWTGRNIGSCFVAALPPADDADTDDEWEVIAESREDAQRALDAENARRAALTGDRVHD